MKRKIFSILFALVMVLSFSLVTTVPAAAEPGDAEGELAGSYSYSWTTSIMNSTDFDFTVGMGWSGPFPYPPNVYYFFHSDEIPPGGYTEPIGGAWLFENIDFDITAAGQTFSVTSAADDADFADFSSLLTNSIDEGVWFGYIGDRDNIASAGGQKGIQESQVFSGTDVGTDFPGYVIKSISLTFNQIYLDPDNVNKLVLDFTIDIYAGPPTEVWVDDDFTSGTPGWGTTQFVTIQGGINNVASDGTVNVATGTYQEKLTVTKSLTFVGEDTAWPTLDIPEGDDGGITITASDVSFENFHFYRQDQEYHTGGFNSIVSVPRGGTWPNYTIEYERVTFRNILFEGARRAAFITAGDLTIEDCEFRDQLRDSLFLANLSGTTNILRNYFAGATDTKKAIIFENHSDADPGVSGTVNIIDNTCVGKNNFLVYNQWLHLDQKVTLNINENDIQNTGSTAIDIYNLNPEEWQGKFDNITALLNSFTGIPDGEYAICNRSTDIAVDATHNWWGNASGPTHASNSAGTGASVSDGVDFIPWLGAEVGTTPMPFIEPVTGADPPAVELEDETGEPIATVDISDGNAAQGTIAGYIEPDDPEPGDTSLAVGTGKEGAFFLDVKVTGYTSGTAHITVPYPDADDDGIVDSTGIVETTLGLYYWDGTTSMWRLATNSTVDAVNNTLSGDIPVSALTGTPIGGGGYPADESTIVIESISNLSYSGNDIVALTITTKTAQLGAATIDLTFNNTVVKVLGGENSDFDSLTVNPNIARFVANQLGATGVDATGGAVLAQVRLKAVATTGSSSSLTLTVVTLKDNDGITIPFETVISGTASIGGLGDTNSDGAVDVYDCVYTARAIAGISGYTLNTLTMDVDGSGEVDAFDCTYLARHIASIAGYEQLGG